MTATLAASIQQAPAAAEIDRLAIEFLALEKKVDEAYKIAVAESKLLHGINYEIMATFGVTTSIDAAAAERFAQALRIAKQTRLLNSLFEQTVRYTLAADASSIIRASALPKPLLALYSQCQVSKPRTPVLKVRQPMNRTRLRPS